MQQVESFLMKQPEVDQVVAVIGFSFSGQGQKRRLGVCFRSRIGASAKGQRIRRKHWPAAPLVRFMGIRDAFCLSVEPTAHSGIGHGHRIQFPLARPWWLGA